MFSCQGMYSKLIQIINTGLKISKSITYNLVKMVAISISSLLLLSYHNCYQRILYSGSLGALLNDTVLDAKAKNRDNAVHCFIFPANSTRTISVVVPET